MEINLRNNTKTRWLSLNRLTDNFFRTAFAVHLRGVQSNSCLTRFPNAALRLQQRKLTPLV